MICQDCGLEAPTKQVTFHQNIGALFVRFPKRIEGRLCKTCIRKHFWGMTTTTFFFGWWGTISFIVTPFFLLNNVGRYLACLGMPEVPEGAAPPQLTDEDVRKIKLHEMALRDRLNEGEEFQSAVRATAAMAGVTPGQIVLFLQSFVLAQQPEASEQDFV
jgi:hypothetical protein